MAASSWLLGTSCSCSETPHRMQLPIADNSVGNFTTPRAMCCSASALLHEMCHYLPANSDWKGIGPLVAAKFCTSDIRSPLEMAGDTAVRL